MKWYENISHSEISVWSKTFTGQMRFSKAELKTTDKDFVIIHKDGVEVFPRHSVRRIACR